MPSSERLAPRSPPITNQDAAVIAHHFGISYQVTVYRLRTLQHLSQFECEELLGLEETGRSYLHFPDMIAAPTQASGLEGVRPS
jgi:Zn-dependent peptidase ImmA (M78 family)